MSMGTFCGIEPKYVSNLGKKYEAKYASNFRSIFTKTVDKDEVGKVFSAVAVVAAVSPFLSNLIFRGVSRRHFIRICQPILL